MGSGMPRRWGSPARREVMDLLPCSGPARERVPAWGMPGHPGAQHPLPPGSPRHWGQGRAGWALAVKELP